MKRWTFQIAFPKDRSDDFEWEQFVEDLDRNIRKAFSGPRPDRFRMGFSHPENRPYVLLCAQWEWPDGYDPKTQMPVEPVPHAKRAWDLFKRWHETRVILFGDPKMVDELTAEFDAVAKEAEQRSDSSFSWNPSDLCL